MIGLLLHQGQRRLAEAEIAALTGRSGSAIGRFFLPETGDIAQLRRLAFTRRIYTVTRSGSRITSKELITNLTKENAFQQRRAHLLPAPHPAMTHPRIARAMLNLSRAKHEILDPFCGAGGILIEAALCSLRATGFDIDAAMLQRARRNLDSFHLRDVKLQQQDATSFAGTYEAIVTDLPYGKNTVLTSDQDSLYLAFLRNIRRNRIPASVIGFPSTCDHRNLITKAKLTLRQEFTYYLHHSLSKKIVVLRLR